MSQNGQTHFRQHLLQDFQSVSDHFGTLCINGLRVILTYNLVYEVNPNINPRYDEIAITNCELFRH